MIVGKHNWANGEPAQISAFRSLFCGKTEELDE